MAYEVTLVSIERGQYAGDVKHDVMRFGDWYSMDRWLTARRDHMVYRPGEIAIIRNTDNGAVLACQTVRYLGSVCDVTFDEMEDRR